MENIFDFWNECYLCNSQWKKYIGILRFRRKIKDPNCFVETAFKGEIYKFVVNLKELLSYRPIEGLKKLNKVNESMW